MSDVIDTKMPDRELFEFKTRTYHGRVGSRRTSGRWGGIEKNWIQTELYAKKTKPLLYLPKHCGHVAGSTASEILCKSIVAKLENSPFKDQLASSSQSGSLNCSRIRSSGSVRSCTVGSRRVKRFASRRGKRVA